MIRRLLGLGIVLVAIPLAASRCRDGAELSGRARGANVVFISVDTLRADHLSYAGYWRQTSPRIDELAAEGAVFSAAYAQRAETWPSLSSIMTSLYPSSHGAVANGYRTVGEKVTLAEILRDHGYETAAFLANMCRANHRGWNLKNCGGDKEVADRAVWWLGEGRHEAKAKKPFFLWVHFMGPHRPYLIPVEQQEALDPGYEGPIDGMARTLDQIMIEDTPLVPADLEHLNALYDGVIQNTDRRVGRILTRLDELDLSDNTLVVFFSDHGEELYEHNKYFFHSCSVYDTTLHIPLIFRLPGAIRARRMEMQVESIDIAPTVLDLLGIARPAEYQGYSLLPYLERREVPREDKPAFSEFGYADVKTVRAGGWKLVSNPTRHTPQCFEGAPADLYPIAETELYDVRRDSGETRNVAPENPRQVAVMKRLIAKRFSSSPRVPGRQDLDAQTRDELRSLGYVNP